MIVTREAATHLGLDIKGATVAVQGFGNVGSVSADLLARHRRADRGRDATGRAASTNAKGLDVGALLAVRRRQHKSVDGFPGGEPLDQRRSSSRSTWTC